MRNVIVFTGGGTAGHVIPNLALIERFSEEGWEMHYIGSAHGPESSMIPASVCRFHAVASGKVRRYFSWQNFIDPFKMITGIVQSWRLLGKTKAQIIFSKGGFVAVPVVLAAWLRRIPVIAHESDFSPGLANRLSYPFARNICVTFEAAKHYFSNSPRVVVTGTPIRKEFFTGVRERGLQICGFNTSKPVLLMMGGSQGALVLNTLLRQALPSLLTHYQVVHICGQGKVAPAFSKQAGYAQFEFVSEALPDLLTMADFVISRAGSNALYELLALQKPHLLIPLSKKVSRGDQLENARYFAKKGCSLVLEEEALTVDALLQSLQDLTKNKSTYLKAMQALTIPSATETIVSLIQAAMTPLDGASAKRSQSAQYRR